MIFAAVLGLGTFAAWLAGHRSTGWSTHVRRGLAAAMVVAGVAHVVGPDPFVQHIPVWVPLREAIVFVTGLTEIAFGIALVANHERRATVGRLLAAYLLAVFPANVYVAVAGVDVDGQPGGAYPWIRLPIQILFVALAVWSTRPEPIDAAQA